MNQKDTALSYFNTDFNCAQSVFTTFGQELGLSEDECLKIACAFGAGMGKQQHVCGAVTGALMVLGTKFGKALNDNDNKKQDTYTKTKDFFKEFESRNGSIHCMELLHGLNMNIEEDLIKIHELDLFDTSCPKYVTDAVEILETFLQKD